MSKVEKRQHKEKSKRIVVRVTTKPPGELRFERRMYGVTGEFDRKWEAARIMHEYVTPFLDGKVPASELKAQIEDGMRRADVAGRVTERKNQEDQYRVSMAQSYEALERLKEQREQFDGTLALLEAEQQQTKAAFDEHMRYVSAIVNMNKRDQQEYELLVSKFNAVSAERNELEVRLLETLKSDDRNATRAERAERDLIMSTGLIWAWNNPLSVPLLVPRQYPYDPEGSDPEE